MSDDKASEATLACEDIKVKTPNAENKVDNKYRWSDRQVELLISEWAREPCLYDATHEDYSKSEKRLRVEKRIVAALNATINSPGERSLTVTDLKKKMNGLRTYHRNLWKKGNEIGSIDESTPSWQYYDQLQFLNDHFTPRETMVTMYMPKRKVRLEEIETSDFSIDESSSNKQPEFEYQMSNVNNYVPMTKSRRIWKPKDDVTMRECATTTRNTKKEKCPEMLFGELVGHSLTNIKDEQTREFAKLQIQQILFKCRYPETDAQNFSMHMRSRIEDNLPSLLDDTHKD